MSKFEELYNNILKRVNEDMPVSLMPGMEGGVRDVPVNFPEKANYALTPEQANNAIADVVDYLSTRNRYSPLPYKLFQTDVISDKIMGRSSLNRTKANYAARVLHNAMIEANIISDERSGTLLNRAPSEEETEEISNIVSRETQEMSQAQKSENDVEPHKAETEEASIYHKAKDFPAEVDNEELEAAWDLIPDNTDIEWTKLLKLIGLKHAEALIDIRAIVPVFSDEEKTREEETEETPILDEPIGDDEYPDLREIDPDIYRRSPYRDL